MSYFLQIFIAQNIFEIKLVEVGDYNSTNQDPPIPKLTSKGDFLFFEKCLAKLVSASILLQCDKCSSAVILTVNYAILINNKPHTPKHIFLTYYKSLFLFLLSSLLYNLTRKNISVIFCNHCFDSFVIILEKK